MTDLANEFAQIGRARSLGVPKEIPTKKRTMLSLDDELVKCLPVEEQMFCAGTWVVVRCKFALRTDHPCTAAFCIMCFEKIKEKLGTDIGEEVASEKGKVPARKRKSGRLAETQLAASAAASSVTVVGTESGGGCGQHIYTDLKSFKMDSDEGYCRRKRDVSEEGRDNVANNCWECGKEF